MARAFLKELSVLEKAFSSFNEDIVYVVLGKKHFF